MVTRYEEIVVSHEIGTPAYTRVVEKSYGKYVLHSDYAALESRLAELEKDAARYRWLKSCPNSYDSPASVTWNMGFDWVVVAGEELERSIDEAMSREA